MSTPFPFEEEAQTNQMRGEWNPWKGPAEPHWYSGMGFNDESHYLGPFGRALDAAGAGAAKGEAVLGGLIHQSEGMNYDVDESGGLTATSSGAQAETEGANPLANAIAADAKMRVQAMTPNPATTGAAVQLMHGVVSGGTEMAIGGLAGGLPGASLFVGSAEGTQRYNELIDAGVDPDTARKSALLAGGTAAVGALAPGGVGSSLLAKVTTGAAGNALFGVANRYADHKILESAGYPEMAEQQKVIDGTQMLTDLILGAGFGGLAHLHSPEVVALRNAPGAREAALTANLAIKDRESAPGIPADPEAANAHQSAHESSIADLMQGKAVDVSDSGVTEAKFVERPDMRDPIVEEQVKGAIRESGLFGEENERDVQAILEGREPESVKSEPPAEEEGYTVGEQELTDEQLKEFQGLRSELPTDQDLAAARGGESGQPRHQDDGRPGSVDGEPLKVFRGSDRELLPEHFDLDSLGFATGHPSSGLGVFFSKDRAEAARYGQVSEHHLDIKNPKVIKAEDLPGFDTTHEANAYREKLRAQGHDGMVIDASHLGGPVNYVAFKPEQVFKAEKADGAKPAEPREAVAPRDPIEQTLADHPGLTIPDENGNPVSAREALTQAHEELATKRRESAIAANAAITCYMRRGN